MVTRWPLALGIAAGTIALLAGLSLGTDTTEGWHMAARWTARIGFPIFLITYCARPLAQIDPADWSKQLWRDRRWWGLGFAASHSIHLLALVTYIQLSGTPRSFASLLPGGTAYIVLYLMAFTSSDGAMRAMGQNWKRLHRFGIHYLWLIFTLAYAKRIAVPETMAEGIIGTLLALAALGLRIAAMKRGRSNAATA